jgi:hypothetical protein
MSGHYLPYSLEQEYQIERATRLLPGYQRSSFRISVRNRLNELTQFNDREVERAVNSVLSSYGVAARHGKTRKNKHESQIQR